MFLTDIPKHYEDELCPSCRSHDKIKIKFIGKLKKRKGKFGDFLGCSRYPKCKFTCKIPSKYRDEFGEQEENLKAIMRGY